MAKGFRHGSGGTLRRPPALNEAYPQDRTGLAAGEQVTFEVLIQDVGSPPEYTCQWFYDGVAVEGQTGLSYTREAEFGAHTVFCTVTNQAGTAISRTAAVTVDTQYLYNRGTISPIAGDVTRADSYNAFSLNADSLHINSTGHNKWGTVHFTNPIDLTNCTTLYMVGTVTITGAGDYWGSLQFGAIKTIGGTPEAYLSGAHSQGTHAVDVSSLSGEYYIGVRLKGFANYAVADIQEVYLK